MRKQVGKAVRKRFAFHMAKSLPQFSQMTTQGILPPGCVLYGYDLAKDMSFYIELLISPKEDEFTVQCAWSLTGQFPAANLPMIPIDLPKYGLKRDQLRNGGMRFTARWLWAEDPRHDEWWRLTERLPDEPTYEDMITEEPVEKALSKVEPSVDDAFGKVMTHAVPYFSGIAKEHGHEWPGSPTLQVAKNDLPAPEAKRPRK